MLVTYGRTSGTSNIQQTSKLTALQKYQSPITVLLQNIPPITAQEQRIPPITSQEQRIPPITVETQHVPPITVQTQHIPTITVHTRHIPPIIVQKWNASLSTVATQNIHGTNHNSNAIYSTNPIEATAYPQILLLILCITISRSGGKTDLNLT